MNGRQRWMCGIVSHESGRTSRKKIAKVAVGKSTRRPIVRSTPAGPGASWEAGYPVPVARLAVIAAALATLLPFPSTADADGGSALALYHVGDSLAAGTSRYLKGFLQVRTVRQDVAIGMRSSEVADLVRSGRSTLPRVIVVSAGTNGTPTAIARLPPTSTPSSRSRGQGGV